ncbi:TetR/AcrR family transcriptional regulator [Microbacterium sp. RD1]|uniref:TetR/AcrR family transcriptional regulator n=1 Tax=Microbacterium sp. RD1 TaxID=3457313 RepID=UPI003FA5E041
MSRADDLLPEIVDVLRARGPEGFVLQTLAEELGTSSRMLIYHFGGRDQLLGRALRLVRADTIRMLEAPPPAGLREAIDRWWEHYTAHLEELQLFFHLTARRFEIPEQFEEFAQDAVHGWVAYFADARRAEGGAAEDADELGRLAVATLRGLAVDLLLTEDRPRVDAALARFQALLPAART